MQLEAKVRLVPRFSEQIQQILQSTFIPEGFLDLRTHNKGSEQYGD